MIESAATSEGAGGKGKNLQQYQKSISAAYIRGRRRKRFESAATSEGAGEKVGICSNIRIVNVNL